ncbi:Alpha-(1,6)-fucosyltransferase [Schistosoma haematobium]|uniref:Alpha-(1,6)-fucosyltransferase n=1 Tax=Schistosoma haematobium TaxID=6185 RepID=A0A922IFM6_SCHHA|nr:Alpha-(1,6)-fucosyltransferase [Schistosoma haematobium]KAH9578487.1 Alpha-(1,6)-fucosyltransferase [Schistosoma haematobium]
MPPLFSYQLVFKDKAYRLCFNYNLNADVDVIGISHETLRRRALNYVHEARYTLNNLRNILNQLKRVNQKELDTETISSIQTSLLHYRQNMEETISHFQIILIKLGELDEFSQIRANGLNKLSQRLQEKIQKQQNPSDCKKAKYVTLDFTNLCGLGCRIHQLMYCLQLALENERVFVLKKHHSGDIFREWLHQSMLPLSDKCSYLDSDGRSDNIECLHIRKAFTNHEWLPHVLPKDMSEELLRLHEAPFVWFGGQLAAYIMRLKPQLAQLINVTLKSFETIGDPVVGVHIRRTDKDMNVETFGSVSKRIIGRENSVQAKRSVYLSTDDPNVFAQLTYSYPNYTVYGSQSRSQSANMNTRVSVSSLNNAIIDIIALSMTDFLVCTLSSNVCRLAYELMQTRHVDLGDATQLVHSIDKLFHEEDYQRMKFDVIIPDMKNSPPTTRLIVDNKSSNTRILRQYSSNNNCTFTLLSDDEDENVYPQTNIATDKFLNFGDDVNTSDEDKEGVNLKKLKANEVYHLR